MTVAEPPSLEFYACRIGSIGHPNQNGDMAYADAIMSTFPNEFFMKHYPERKEVTATFLGARLVRSDGSEQSTRASFLFNFGANRFYPESDPTEGRISIMDLSLIFHLTLASLR